ncbi:hypothetical protein HU200_015225 [Digitaria exilis]|uniref:RRM domain-containing protein n=1 Tax=Digitaria exilis TaxID=1010633 RepID=A0A835FAK8_9POAL|nr:hypothetical protein HU200_015225 [Digitaria exilis]
MADRYRAYVPSSSYYRDSRGGYSEYLAPEGSLASSYAPRSYVVPDGPDVLRNDVALQPRAYGLDGPAGVISPALPGHSGLAAVARARGPSPLEDPSLAVMSRLAPARVPGRLLEEPAVAGRCSSLGKGAGSPDVVRHSPFLDLDGPSDDESNILFVDCLPTDCTRREVARIPPTWHFFVSYFRTLQVSFLQALTFAGRFVSALRRLQGHQSSAQGAQALLRIDSCCYLQSGDKAYVLCFVEFESAKYARTAMNKLRGPCSCAFDRFAVTELPPDHFAEYRFDDRKPDSPCLKIQFARFPFRLPTT